jgi:hypothetical protein
MASKAALVWPAATNVGHDRGQLANMAGQFISREEAANLAT